MKFNPKKWYCKKVNSLANVKAHLYKQILISLKLNPSHIKIYVHKLESN